MQKQFVVGVTGQEVEVSDLNAIAASASQADDKVFAELLRIPQYDGSHIVKGVLPYGQGDIRATSLTQQTAVVGTYIAANATVYVPPMRFFVGGRAVDLTTADNRDLWYSDVRSAALVGSVGTVANLGNTNVQLAATASNNRKDLVYARVDIDAAQTPVTRYVKAADGTEGTQNISVFYKTTVTIGVVQGTEAATPVEPALPSDSGNSYYIPLAYVSLAHPHTLTSFIQPSQIGEVAPVVNVASIAGGVDCKPASVLSSSGYLTATWGAGLRPESFLPSSMSGKVERVFGFDFTGGKTPIPLNTYTTIDNSIDWRNRLFKSTFYVEAVGPHLPWKTGGTNPSPGFNGYNNLIVQMGQSFRSDTYGSLAGGIDPASSRGHVLLLDSATVSGFPTYMQFFVDSSGALRVHISAASPNSIIIGWIEATGPFTNAF